MTGMTGEPDFVPTLTRNRAEVVWMFGTVQSKPVTLPSVVKKACCVTG